MTQARTTTVNITYKGKDISQDIAPFLTSFTFTDNSGGTADDISITLQDRNSLWLDDWFPSKGDKITCSIIQNDTVTQSLPCGVYEVDQIDYSAPPHTITIKAVSCAITQSLKAEKHNHVWENSSLRVIASDIASGNSLALYYDAADFQILRIEQILQSDLEFLHDICINYGLSLKVNENKLIIFDEDKNDNSASVSEISSTDENLISWKFTTKASQIYRSAKLSYHHANNDEDYIAEETDDSVEGTERVLELHEYAESQSQAKEICKRRLYEANQREITGTLTLKGSVKYRAGITITILKFGAFSGKYSVTQTTHSISTAGYTLSVNVKQNPTSKKQARSRKKSRQTPKEIYYTGTKYYGYKGE